MKIIKQTVTPFLEVWEYPDSGYKSLFLSKDVVSYTVLSKFGYDKILATPGRYTVQVSDAQHIELAPTYLRYTNHSCNPNVFFNIRQMSLVALRPIQQGEEVTFFYPSTEWEMNEPFDCICGSEECLGSIKGAAHLGYDNLLNYRLSDHVINRYMRLAQVQYERFVRFSE